MYNKFMIGDEEWRWSLFENQLEICSPDGLFYEISAQRALLWSWVPIRGGFKAQSDYATQEKVEAFILGSIYPFHTLKDIK